MDAVLTVVAPVFGVLLFGYAATRLNFFDDNSLRGLTYFVFNFVIPPMLFRKVALADLPEQLPWGYLLSYFLATLVVFVLGMLFAKLLFKYQLGETSMLGFNAGYGNTVLMGIPLVLTTFGDEAAVPLFLIIALHSPIFMPVMTLLLEIARGQREALRQIPWNTLQGLLRNPIVMGLLTGLLFNLFNVPIP